MKIKLDKKYTNAHHIEIVKDAISDFRACFKAVDLLLIFEENLGRLSCLPERRITETEVIAFSSNDRTENVSFQINMVVKIPFFEYHEIRFYIEYSNGLYTINEDLHEDIVFLRK